MRSALEDAGLNQIEITHEHAAAGQVSVWCQRKCSHCGFSAMSLDYCADGSLSHLHMSPHTGLAVQVAYDGYEVPLTPVILGV